MKSSDIPDYQQFMLPLLKILSDGQLHRLRDLVPVLASEFGLPEDCRNTLLDSGQPVIDNRIGWSRSYLKKAGLVENPKRGYVKITESGREVLNRQLEKIDKNFLKQFDSFVEFLSPSVSEEGDPKPKEQKEAVVENETPEEQIDSAFDELNKALADDVLDLVKRCSAAFFEKLVVDLLVAMGYGGTLEDAGQVMGKSGDGGIDGLIKEDKLGLDNVCIQAKRWTENTVGRPVVQSFAGSMEGFRARKGVMITTSTFSKEAKEYVGNIERKIVLIDGKLLTELMIEHDVGVSEYRKYQLKRIDTDYFPDDLD
ncbi:restriction endonuclease [Planctomycetaceae bacterium]|nr:restriction endonuclease [Planctomycetaceae bacterium]